MTILVGIHSEEGAVIAADRQITHGNLVGMPSSKVRCLNDGTIFAASGPVGLGQQVEFVLSSAYGKFAKQMYAASAIELQPLIQNNILAPGYTIAKSFGGMLPLCMCLFASTFHDGPAIAYMDDMGNFTKLDGEHPFICLGSGGPNGTAILSSHWSVFFSKTPPSSLQEAIFAAYSTVNIAIEIRSPGVGFEGDVCILRYPNKSSEVAKAEQVPQEELQEHGDYIGWMREALISSRQGKIKSSIHTGSQLPSMEE